ncbi:tannase/feruloyl esterase family alpha/beta hydrolase [Neisseria chenwenguii]|uniref:Tannase/feruloyl esterase family alpha/beta hydrolase n=1 Tax=Neisseria chenwenguii TaxID=1853278 RepID=A0A220S1M1_9NEIS|nr:tannase/feruloyl esterase family alpha/beta hydrolase [Neisseria chenwenguii]ASK27379.1 tannase/feruloyl esterase family alpha/beta hydrolase [Neisseria chenwenguii]ROV56950.1 tannase/feruloyl esterase family alpha/beta hydrolase [Neisseria chenwenguii]
MKPHKILPALLAAVAAPAFAASAEQCTALKNAKIADTQITKAEWSADGSVGADRMSALTGGAAQAQKAGAHCVVEGEIGARTGVDGKHYGTKFQLRLPAQWNGRFLFQGGGGVDGFVAPAVGSVPVRSSTATPALMRGYAVVSMDGGHPTPTPDFGADPDARLDFAYRSIGKTTAAAKELLYRMYRAAPKHSYFMGCSNGGREAMIAAQRYPQEFDGVIAANPGFRLSRAAVAEVWDTHQFMKIAPKNSAGQKILANALTQKDLDKVSRAVLKRCDAKDGLKDGVINAWESCDFKPESAGLGRAKTAVLKAVFGGAKNSKGQQIYSGWFYDTGISAEGWRSWKLGNSQTAKPDARNITLGEGSLKWYFMTPAVPDFDVAKFDFDRDTPKTYATGKINDATATDMSGFKVRGGRFIIATGISDPVFSAKDQRDWFRQMQRDTAGAEEFSRMFMVPGMTHCGGGQAFDDFDPLTALENWHDKGQAPERLTAKGKAFPGRSMPLCAYPKTAVYTGGDKNKAESFTCR